MLLSLVGDGAFVRAGLEVLVDFLKRFAAPTGARGSVLFMWGGLIILGFLFLAFLFRSAIVGDLAPVANARTPAPRTLLPGSPPRAAPGEPIVLPSTAKRRFETGRSATRGESGNLDAALARLHAAGLDLRVVRNGREWKRLRAYRCPSCADERGRGCEFERGLIAGTFESLTRDLVKVEEVSCRRDGAPQCEFDVRHAPFLGALR